MRRAARKDSNHDALAQALEAYGWLVWPTHQLGGGYPDFTIAKQGRLVLVEVKDGSLALSRQALTPDEARCHVAFKAHGVTIELLTKVEDIAVLERPVTPHFYAQERNR